MHKTQRKILQISQTQDISKLSLRVLGKLIGEVHPQVVKYHLNALEKAGELSLNKIGTVSNKLETLHHNNPSTKTSTRISNLIEVPILGMASCGVATQLATEQDLGVLTLSSSILNNHGEFFALKAKGNSMNRANINGLGIDSGDYVIVDKSNVTPRSGVDYVVSIINGAANIKKFYLDTPNKQIVLVSESSENNNPIHISIDDIDEYVINGVVKQVVKNPIKD
ncbi:MAG: S24 family peptidase [Candidatus Dojkabacteria bacterium]